MNVITDVTAIERLIDHCKKCQFTITTGDLSAKSLADNTLIFANDSHKSIDFFTVRGKFANEDYIETEGRLFEVLFHFNLLDEDEMLNVQSSSGNILSMRSTIIRSPWDRII